MTRNVILDMGGDSLSLTRSYHPVVTPWTADLRLVVEKPDDGPDALFASIKLDAGALRILAAACNEVAAEIDRDAADEMRVRR